MAFLEKSNRRCTECGDTLGRFWGDDICPKCRDEKEKELLEIENQKNLNEQSEYEKQHKKIESIYKDVIVSTTPTLEGYQINEYLGIESAEIIVGTGIFTDFRASISDFLGGRADGYENSIANAKQEAFDILKFKGASLGGNAIVGIDIDYMGIGDNMFGVIVEGTVVKITRKDN